MRDVGGVRRLSEENQGYCSRVSGAEWKDILYKKDIYKLDIEKEYQRKIGKIVNLFSYKSRSFARRTTMKLRKLGTYCEPSWLCVNHVSTNLNWRVLLIMFIYH